MATEQVDIPSDVEIFYDGFSEDAEGRIGVLGMWGRETLPSGEVSFRGRRHAYVYRAELDELTATIRGEQGCTERVAEGQALVTLLRRDGIVAMATTPVPTPQTLGQKYWDLRCFLVRVVGEESVVGLDG